MSNHTKSFMHSAAHYNDNGDAKAEAEKLILCDCNGTLFLARSGEAVNVKLLTFLSLAKRNGFKVQLVSNDPGGNESNLQMTCMRYFRDADYFGEIHNKVEYSGKKAFLVIDDDHSSHNIKAFESLNPLNDALFERLSAELAQRLNEAPFDFKRSGPANTL